MSSDSIVHESYISTRINHFLTGAGFPPVPDHIMMSLLVTLLLMILALLIRRNMQLLPQGMQNVIEKIFDMVEEMMRSIIGSEGPRYFPVIATVGLFILTGNLIGLVPFLGSPTNNINVTLGCALFVFFYYHYQGLRRRGFRSYIAHFAGPIWWMAH